MTSISGKRQRLHDSVGRRLRDQRLNNTGDFPTSYLVFSLALIPVCVFSGMLIAEYHYLLSLESFEQDAEYNYSIDGYKILFVSPEENKNMEGNWGFTYRGRTDDIFINKELLRYNRFDLIRETCQHEKLHNLGLSSKHHHLIDIYEGQISDPTCKKLVEQLKN